MIQLQAQNIARHFGADILFDKANLEIKSNDRIGLVGRNGAGKSTILHIIAGLEEPDEGKISKRKDLTIGYLDQHTGLYSDKTIFEEMLTVYSETLAIKEEMHRLEEKLGQINEETDSTHYHDILSQYDNIQRKFTLNSGYTYESEIKTVLSGFRFYEEDYDKFVNELSGGQKTRLAMARILLEKKDLLVLDEPTNHLDIDTLAWLESYLKQYDGALLIVSHDRYFLDSVTNKTYEVSQGRVNYFPGNYSKYLTLKSEQLQKQMKEYEKQQKKISQLEDFVNRNIVRASTTKRAQSKRKELEKMDRIQKPIEDNQSMHFSFNVERDSGNVVLQTDDLSIGYDKNEPLSKNINLDLRKFESVALVGPNGVGKSTLLKTLVGILSPINGQFELGTKVDIGYYDQEQSHLSLNKTVLDEIWDEHPAVPELNIRTLLGSFLFSGEDVEKSISALSGGERARVALAKLAMNKDNFLVLDEPTNHLDIDSKEVLENALVDFDGTILFVSHDRYFINRMASKVIEINEDGIDVYLGDYDYYLEKKAQLRELALAEQAETDSTNEETTQVKSTNALSRQEQKEIQKEIRRLERQNQEIESELETIDNELQQVNNELTKPEVYGDLEKLQEYNDKHTQLDERQISLLEKWENVQLELSDYLE